MSEEISVQILSQASENIQKLFDLSTRIDERVKTIKEQQEVLDNKISRIIGDYNEIATKVAVLQIQDKQSGIGSIADKCSQIEKNIIDIDKRLSSVEAVSSGQSDRWNKIISFVIQLVWIIVAAWALMSLGLNSPPVP